MFFFCSAEVSLFNKILKCIEALVTDFKVLSVEISLLHAQPFVVTSSLLLNWWIKCCFNGLYNRVDVPEKAATMLVLHVLCRVALLCWMILPHDVICLGCCSNTWEVASFTIMREWKCVFVNARAIFLLLWQNFETHTKMGYMHHCVWGLCCIIQWNNLATCCYIVVTSYLIFNDSGNLI
jgi:hypothetical protein